MARLKLPCAKEMRNCVGPLRVLFVRLGKPVETLMTLLFLVIKEAWGAGQTVSRAVTAS